MNFNPMSLLCVHYVYNPSRPKQQHIIIIVIVKCSMWKSLLFVHFSFFQRNHKSCTRQKRLRMVIVRRTAAFSVVMYGSQTPIGGCSVPLVQCFLSSLFYIIMIIFIISIGQRVSAFNLGNCFPTT